MSGNSFDEAWIVWTVTQGFAQALDRIIQSLIEINEGIQRARFSLAAVPLVTTSPECFKRTRRIWKG